MSWRWTTTKTTTTARTASDNWIREAGQRARERIAALERLALQAGELAEMDYDFLFDEARQLLAIGYNVTDHRQDASYYDLLASEARLCSFVAIAQGQLPQESWFALGRLLTGRRRRADARCPGAARCSNT